MSTDDYPRVLVISHNPFSDQQNNGKTLQNFFKNWPKNKISQLYFTLENPSYTICNNYYRILDIDVLKRFFQPKTVVGEVISRVDNVNNRKKKLNNNRLYVWIKEVFKNNSPFALLVRDFFWNKEYWKIKGLEQWLDQQNPELVFFQSSNCPFSYNIVEWVCKSRNLPLIMQTTDDYITAHFSINLFYWMHYFKLKKCYKKAVVYSDYVVAIGDLMANEYKQRFGGNYKVAMNSVPIENVQVHSDNIVEKNGIKFLFAGNVGLNRWKILVRIAETLHELNQEGYKVNFEIYSLSVPNNKILKKMNISSEISFRGSLNSDELEEKIKDSDILVHVEAFNKKYRNITRLSISTKIPEYMKSKRCIFAVGPNDIASLKYIKDYNFGVVINSIDKNILKKTLKNLIIDNELRSNYTRTAFDLVKRRHEINETSAMIKEIVNSSVSKGREEWAYQKN